MEDNPWVRLPEEPPYVLPEDAESVARFNRNKTPNHELFLQVDRLLPEPFIGDPAAPVVLLTNNPGFTEWGLEYRQALANHMRTNLNQQPQEYPFYYFAPEFPGPGRDWWGSKLRKLIEKFGEWELAHAVVEVVYFPYPSNRYGHGNLHLPSQEYGFRLVRNAMDRDATIVLMRGVKRWLRKLPELETYSNLCLVRNVRQPAISPRNCPDFEKVRTAIAAAVAQRSRRS